MYPRAGHQPLGHATTNKEEKEVFLSSSYCTKYCLTLTYAIYRVKFKESYQFVSNEAFSSIKGSNLPNLARKRFVK